MTHKKSLLLGFIVAIGIFWIVNYFSLNHSVKADSRDKWEGKVEQQLIVGEERDKAIFSMIKDMRDEVKNICSDITEIKVKAAQNGALYGGGSGLAIYLMGLLGNFLRKKP